MDGEDCAGGLSYSELLMYIFRSTRELCEGDGGLVSCLDVWVFVSW